MYIHIYKYICFYALFHSVKNISFHFSIRQLAVANGGVRAGAAQFQTRFAFSFVSFAFAHSPPQQWSISNG